jgi:hypothetical protein
MSRPEIDPVSLSQAAEARDLILVQAVSGDAYFLIDAEVGGVAYGAPRRGVENPGGLTPTQVIEALEHNDQIMGQIEEETQTLRAFIRSFDAQIRPVFGDYDPDKLMIRFEDSDDGRELVIFASDRVSSPDQADKKVVAEIPQT